jgi:hypothetical protein
MCGKEESYQCDAGRMATVKTQGYEVRECDRDITRETPVKIQK